MDIEQKPKRKKANPPIETVPEETTNPSVVNLRKKLSLEDKRMRRSSGPAIASKINNLAKRGLITPDLISGNNDPALLDQYIRLYNIGATDDVIMKVLNITKFKCSTLLEEYQDFCVDGIVKLGPLGVLGTAYTRVHALSQQALAALAVLPDTPNANKEKLELMRFIKDVEAEKVRMMVMTGAIAQRKRVPLHQHFEEAAGMSRVMQPSKLLSLLDTVLALDELGNA